MNNINNVNVPITLKVNVSDKGILEEQFTFNSNENVWSAKERVIHELGKDLKNIQNYGFYVPPDKGKAGKFMDEGRPLSEYVSPEKDEILEFMLKRRVYRSMAYNENKLTKVNNKHNMKKLMECVDHNNAAQVNQLLEKGLDPNFQDIKSGETPLTMAAMKNNANSVIMYLINGGAYFDFKNRDGLTPVHKAAIAGNSHNMKIFLDLGASPNYRDLKGLTPLYHACISGKNPNVAELLLADQADIGVVDSQGWREIHQACRYGYVEHVEQLIFYGADLNIQNGSGNTPLHICALYNQESCARLLLYRGARRDIVNFAKQTAEMVAVVATNGSLYSFIKNYKESDVVPFIDKPTYSTRRRNQSKSRPTANSVFLRGSTDAFIFCTESLSNTSSTPSIHSENSEPMSLDLSPREIVPSVDITEVKESIEGKPRRQRTLSGSGSDSSYASDSGDENSSKTNTPMVTPSNDELTIRWRTYSISSLNKEERGNIPRVKEVKGAANMEPRSSKTNSRKMFIAVTNFTPTQAGELSLSEGDLVEIITMGEKGYWQGSVAGKTGWFPADCVEDLKKRKQIKSKTSLHKPASIASSLNKSNTSLDQPYNVPLQEVAKPRQVILHKSSAGYGFQMRGANIPAVNKLEFKPSEKIPALQYVGDVEPGKEADKRGIKKGDYILEVNGNDVRTASHRHVVSLIRKAGASLILKLITLDNDENKISNNLTKEQHTNDSSSQESTSPSYNAMSIPPPPPSSSSSVPINNSHQLDHNIVLTNGSHTDGSSLKIPPPIPSRAPTTSLSVRPKPSRISASDINFDEAPAVQEDRVISVPRERVTATEQQWHSPLTGYSSLPRRPKSSYGAIIGSPHTSPTESKMSRNFQYDNNMHGTASTIQPLKVNGKENTMRHTTTLDDSAVLRRRPGSARSARDRPKSWMPKVLPTEPPPISPPIPRQQYSRGHHDDEKSLPTGESKKDKKRRFSFRKKKEKDYLVTTESRESEEKERNENNIVGNDVTENLHIEGEETRPNSLPGLPKRLSTFKPINIPQRPTVHHEVVSPELSEALEKRMSRVKSTGDEEISPRSPSGTPVFPSPPSEAPPPPPKHKSLEDSIKEEMMRRRFKSVSSSSVPEKPRRTFEYKKSNGDLEEEVSNSGHGEELESELAKAVAKRAAKLSTGDRDSHIYENVQDLHANQTKETGSHVEEPPPMTIQEKLKKLNLAGEAIFPKKFKPPVATPQSKSNKKKPPVQIPNEKTSANESGKFPPTTFPKPKKKSFSPTSKDDVEETTRPNQISVSSDDSSLSPSLLSPEMVATKLLDDVIKEEEERSNLEKDTSSSEKSSTIVGEDLTTSTQFNTIGTEPVVSKSQSSKKYIYTIKLVTEKPSVSIEGTQTITHVNTKDTSYPENPETPLPLPQPPAEYVDENHGVTINHLPSCSSQPQVKNIDESDGASILHLPTTSTQPQLENDMESNNQDVLNLPPPLTQSKYVNESNEESIPLPQTQIKRVDGNSEITSPNPSSSFTIPPMEYIDNKNNSTTCDVPPLVKPPSEYVDRNESSTCHDPPPVEPPLEYVDEKQLPSAVFTPPSSSVTDSPPQFSPPPPVSFSPLPPPVLDEDNLPPPPPPEFLAGLPESSELNEESTKELPSEVTRTNDVSLTSHEHSTSPEGNGRMEKHSQVSTVSSPDNLKNLTSDESLGVIVNCTDEHKANGPKQTVQDEVFNHQDGFSYDKSESSKLEQESNVSSMNDADGSSQDVLGKNVQALSHPKDQYENNLETFAAEDGKEQAPSTTNVSDETISRSSFREVPYEDWSGVHVCEWLVSINMAEHCDLFRENDIRGSNLVKLNKEDLRELGVKKLGHRMTIANEVKQLSANNGASTNL